MIVLGACGTLPRNAVPPSMMVEATIPGMPDVRAPAGQVSAIMTRDLEVSFAQERPEEFPRQADGLIHYAHLAISGGGANGAFGAGFLNGWTQTGRRPVFKIVTGVSTGALIAPFAFIGPAHDDALREFYTTTTSQDIFIFRLLSVIPRLLGGDALADARPLAALIARYVDAALLAEIADAHLHGRRLYIGTADLDSQRFIVWNMGLIATSDRPEALDLFRQVMLASASIPIAFPPVLIEVESNGARYDEMHVDGAVAANVFYTGGIFRSSAVRERAGRGGGREEVFVIHNGQLGGTPQATRRTLASIALRTLDSAAKAATVGDLFRIHTLAARQGAGFRWINIPNGVELRGDEVFDPARMQELYEIGRQRALEGPPWFTGPPGIWQE